MLAKGDHALLELRILSFAARAPLLHQFQPVLLGLLETHVGIRNVLFDHLPQLGREFPVQYMCNRCLSLPGPFLLLGRHIGRGDDPQVRID